MKRFPLLAEARGLISCEAKKGMLLLISDAHITTVRKAPARFQWLRDANAT